MIVYDQLTNETAIEYIRDSVVWNTRNLSLTGSNEHKITTLPSDIFLRLTCIYKLSIHNTDLTVFPKIPSTISFLDIHNNVFLKELTYPLPKNLLSFDLRNTKIKSLPQLPSNLHHLILPKTIQYILGIIPCSSVMCIFCFVRNNPGKMDYIINMNTKRIDKGKQHALNKIRYTFYLMKCRKRLRKWLWEYALLKYTERKYHPNVLKLELEKNPELNEWI